MLQPGLNTSNPQSNYRGEKKKGGVRNNKTLFSLLNFFALATLLNKPPSLQSGFPEQLAA